MQPYFFPYIGYFQLIHAVDKFVVYDDVNYINRGWVNRNNILVNGNAFLMQVPLQDASQNKLIRDIPIVTEDVWKIKLAKTIHQNYKKAPFFEPVFNLFESVLYSGKASISSLNTLAIQRVCEYVDIQTEIVPECGSYNNKHLKGQERILDICVQENAKQYINPTGGRELYDEKIFDEKNIKLNFIHTTEFTYKQFKNDFVPYLSMLDIMMFNSVVEIKDILNTKYELQ